MTVSGNTLDPDTGFSSPLCRDKEDTAPSSQAGCHWATGPLNCWEGACLSWKEILVTTTSPKGKEEKEERKVRKVGRKEEKERKEEKARQDKTHRLAPDPSSFSY